MADYLGYNAPSFVLYSDGQLLKHNPGEDPWYCERHLSEEEMNALFYRIKSTGFLSIEGDGSKYEEDPIYNLPAKVEEYYGPGSTFFEVQAGELRKWVSIDGRYADYVIPEISNALKIIGDYRPDGMIPYHPGTWVVWFEDEDPCGIPFDYQPWPNGMPEIASYLHAAHRVQLVFQDSTQMDFSQLLGTRPNTFLLPVDEVDYYILTRPLLPHELPSDFPVY